MTTLSASATDNAGNVGTGSTTFSVSVTCNSLCRLTRQLFEGSPKFAALPPRLRLDVDNLATQLCQHLANVASSLTPLQKARFIAAYQAGVAALTRDGWLTQTQAATLIQLSKVL